MYYHLLQNYKTLASSPTVLYFMWLRKQTLVTFVIHINWLMFVM